MARGQKDFGVYATKTVGGGLSDLGELAARLGSIDIYDRRGDVVEFDNFEEPILRWLTDYTGVEGTTKLDSTSFRSGSQSVYIATGSGSDVDQFIYRRTSILASQLLGMEISFGKLAQATNLHIILSYRENSTYYRGQVKIDPILMKVYIEGSDGNYIDVADTGILPDVNFSFFNVKLVVDFSTSKYKRLLFANHEYDISNYAIKTGTTVLAPTIENIIRLANRDTTAGEVFIDDYILTQAEP